MSRHLSANDYYSEGETIIGYWRGNAAKILGIEGTVVTREHFEALRNNKHPLTGEKLRPRDSMVKFHDVVISAPKSFSVAAMVGGDERLVEAFERVVERSFKRLEYHAEARVRSGGYYNTEQTIRTGNGVAAVYHHDASRLLEPQMHAHLVFSNHTWETTDGRWLALQPKRMMEMSKSNVRRSFYRDLAHEAEKLGYEVEWRGESFGFKGIDKRIENVFSVRSQQRDQFKNRYQHVFGEQPDKKRIEYFIKDRRKAAIDRFKSEYKSAFGKEADPSLVKDFIRDSRSDKMADSSRAAVRSRQREIAIAASCDQRISQVVQGARSRVGVGEPVAEAERLSTKQQVQSNPQRVISKQRKNTKFKNNRHSIERMEAIRRMKRGMLIVRALQGHPALLIAAQFTQSAKERNRNETR